MSRVARSPWFLVLALTGFVAGPLLYGACARTHTAVASASPKPGLDGSPLESAELDSVLRMSGLDARALTAVGVSANGVAALVDEVRDALATHGAALVTSEESMEHAQVASDALRRKIQGGHASPEDVTAYQTQLQTLATATAARASALAACRAPLEAQLSQTQRAQLTRIRANRHRSLPIEYLLVDRGEAQWTSLRDALANEKIAPRYGESVSPQQASILASARSHPDVAAARTRLLTHLGEVEAAMHAATID